jgi:hypothetical protein
MIIIHMFFQSYYTIFLIICYKSFSSPNVWIKSMHVTKQTYHDLRISKINFFCHHSHNKQPNKLHSYNGLSIFSFEHVLFKRSLPFHYSCRNPNLKLVAKATGCKVAGQEKDLGVTSHAHRSVKSVREWTFTLPSELPCWELESQMESQTFRARL